MDEWGLVLLSLLWELFENVHSKNRGGELVQSNYTHR
jgi:hypothetical protein